MAETLISPGVLARENDQSQLTSQPVQAGAAIIGPAVKGPVEIPTKVTSYTEYLANFGSTFESGSDEYTYFTSISAYNYFQNGGSTLIVNRVTSGSFNEATSSYISGSSISSGEANRLVLETIGEGEIMNSLPVAQTGDTITDGANNTLASGSKDNMRWEIASPNTASGTFSVIIRRGNDTGKSKTVLETFTNVSLDPNQLIMLQK